MKIKAIGLLFGFFFLTIVINYGYTREKPHANLFKSEDGKQPLYCVYCHKLRNSGNVNPLWRMDKTSSYKDYISASLTGDLGSYANVDIDYSVSSIVELCLGCHEMTKHDNDFGHSFSAKVIGNKKTKIKAKLGTNGKISNKLKLYNNTMTCTTCHDPHSSTFKLLTDTQDKLCNECHDK